jgi:AcrR family transcriptional regulator
MLHPEARPLSISQNTPVSRKRRPYRLAARALRQDETRQRIVQATMELHCELGPARTTISAIADRAGVERLTVYRHFPDLASVFRACSAHFYETFPAPDTEAWGRDGDGPGSLEAALTELYAYYATIGPLGFARILRDAPDLPELAEVLERTWLGPVSSACDRLVARWEGDAAGRPVLRAAIDLAMQFSTWEALTARGLDQDTAVGLMVGLVRAAAPGTSAPVTAGPE